MSRIPYKRIVAVAFVLGLFMEILDTTIVNVALPTLASELPRHHDADRVGGHGLPAQPGAVDPRLGVAR